MGYHGLKSPGMQGKNAINIINRSLLGARMLLGAPGLTTSNKKLLGAPGSTTSNKKLLGAPGATRSKDALELSA